MVNSGNNFVVTYQAYSESINTFVCKMLKDIFFETPHPLPPKAEMMVKAEAQIT